jgi:hypothetical protein
MATVGTDPLIYARRLQERGDIVAQARAAARNSGQALRQVTDFSAPLTTGATVHPPERAAPHPARCGPGRQGVLLTRHPRPPAQTRNPGGHPDPARPARPLTSQGQPWWQATGLRPRRLPPAQHPRAVHQPSEAVARPGHPIRQDRDHLPRRNPPRRHPHLVSPMIQTKRPSPPLKGKTRRTALRADAL